MDRALESEGYHVEDLSLGEGREAAVGDFLTVSYRIWVVDEGAQGIEVLSLRNKQNRLEQLFLEMVTRGRGDSTARAA